MRRVLVPTDFSEAALFVTREVMTWVDVIGGEILLLHVVPGICLGWLDPLAIRCIDQTILEDTYEDLYEEGQRKFSTWLPSQDNERCRALIVVGDIADTIVEVAQLEMVDLIIMRAPKRRWWRPILAGSVTNAVMRRASVPVVVWGSLDPIASNGFWQGARRPHERHTLQKSACEKGEESDRSLLTS